MKSYFAIGTQSNKNWIKTESIERGTDNKEEGVECHKKKKNKILPAKNYLLFFFSPLEGPKICIENYIYSVSAEKKRSNNK